MSIASPGSSAPPAAPLPADTPSLSQRPWLVAIVGMIAMASAMGVGRFAFTPLLPMMLHDGTITLTQGSWLAMSNYIGYFVGSVVCMALPWVAKGFVQRWHPARMVHWWLFITVLLTAAMALHLPAAWASLRFVSGVASAVVFLNITLWCMSQLAHLGRPALGGLLFCGPGIGIAITGLATSAMVAAQWHAVGAWLVFAVLALLFWAMVLPVVRGVLASPAVVARPAGATAQAAEGPFDRALLTLAYSFAGLGYIVTATYLPVIARGALPAGSMWPDLFWPMFGGGVALGAYLSTHVPSRWDRRKLLMAGYAIQAVSIGVSYLWPTPLGFALGSIFLGLPFTTLTFFALQEARRIWPEAISSFPGLITAAYGLGQIVGPPMVAYALTRTANTQTGFAYGLAVAAGALLLGCLLYGWMVLRHPHRVA